MFYPKIIQGGMGVGVSNWVLARAVSIAGQLGVVSGTALDVVLARRLQSGDPEGHVRRALDHFPFPEIARRVWDQYFVEGGIAPGQPYKPVPLFSANPHQNVLELNTLANFVEVFLAKAGHAGEVGINFLEKIQLPTLSSIFGAMLAGVDFILMGAGIPRAIPGVLDHFAQGEAVKLKIDVEGATPDQEFATTFDPVAFCGGTAPKLKRPNFLAIISSATLALTLARKSSGKVDGFIVEGETAGGHNAPPRGPMQLSEKGEPVYGERDVPDLVKIAQIGLPFWLAGSYGAPGRLAQALMLGAVGIQVGTAFAFCEESGIAPELKGEVLCNYYTGNLKVHTDPLASPTGFPFKVLQVDSSISNPAVYNARSRICDLGYLRHPYRKEDGTLGYRCPAEPVPNYLRKGGQEQETHGRKCVCNGLLSTIGLGQVLTGGAIEPPLLTAGDDVVNVGQFLKPGHKTYTAKDVIDTLLA
ncbi:MAG: nitronate monooxygenase [Verrucomicrobia bacterium]|nr:nitronate monooxygenase [Verrucomicrobiota bacterium]